MEDVSKEQALECLCWLYDPAMFTFHAAAEIPPAPSTMREIL